ncbi:MAG: regulatory protein RecX [Candidatus Omnitrophota bacterium]|nr:regulatory protein RecX [Candidatus Omnitrophota bacterium]
MKKQLVKSQAWLHNTEKAKAYAFLLLKFRLRSENELLARLKQKGFSQELAVVTVNFLKDKKFIDDRVFARGWIAARLRRPFGIRRIRQELLAKGLSEQVIEDSLGQAKKDYSESQVVSRLAQQRFSKLAGIEPQKAKARVYAYLLRRGFSPGIVTEIVNKQSLPGAEGDAAI